MGSVVLTATMSLDGFVARPDDSVGPLFDWYSAGAVDSAEGDPQRRFTVTPESADWMARYWSRVGVSVIGRHLFDHTDGWGGRPAAGDHVVVVTHRPAREWRERFPGAPFTFAGGVAAAVEAARGLAGDRDVVVTAGDVGGQAFAAGLVDEVDVALAPVVLGGGKRFFGAHHGTVRLEDPHDVVATRRVTHLRYRVG